MVVLYRAGYGSTKWTRIEESAITSRGVNFGWNFVLLVPLDGTKPNWLPDARLWFGVQQFGAQTAAEVIAPRFADLGATPHPETVIDKAARAQRRVAGEQKAEQWRRSVAGLEEAKAEVQRLGAYLQEQVAAIGEAAPAITPHFRESQSGVFEVRVPGATLTFGWHHNYPNSLDGIPLSARTRRQRSINVEVLTSEPAASAWRIVSRVLEEQAPERQLRAAPSC